MTIAVRIFAYENDDASLRSLASNLEAAVADAVASAAAEGEVLDVQCVPAATVEHDYDRESGKDLPPYAERGFLVMVKIRTPSTARPPLAETFPDVVKGRA